jgi:hypothetical protein
MRGGSVEIKVAIDTAGTLRKASGSLLQIHLSSFQPYHFLSLLAC